MNQEFTFEELNSPHSEGWRGTGINTAQSNYVFFSDRDWNPLIGSPPTRKDFTKWQGKNNQFWEDLLNGDDDYNDLKFWHRLGWTYDGFMYEGIQCYVYGVEAPPKIMRKIDPSTKCDTRILQASFKDMVLRRVDCGNKIPDITAGPDQDWECGECISDNTWYVNPASLAWRITDSGGTEVTNSLTEKNTWVQVGTSNNPANGWTQHMKDYGIYPAVPIDTVEDPLMDSWQSHITSVNFATSGTYTIRIESDNYGYIRLIDSGSNEILDEEINYSGGIGQATYNLSLSAGNYTLETRVKNIKRGNYVVRLNDKQTIKAAVGLSLIHI